jgi:hypothetical protein
MVFLRYTSIAVVAFFTCTAQPAFAESVQVDSRSSKNIIHKEIRSIVINAKCDKVWPLLVDFGNIASWYSAFKSSKSLNGGDNQVGTIREIIRSSNGQTVQEELIYRNDSNFELAYTHIKNGPARETINQVKLEPLNSTSQCFVSWSSIFRTKDGQEGSEVSLFFSRAFDKVLADLKHASER